MNVPDNDTPKASVLRREATRGLRSELSLLECETTSTSELRRIAERLEDFVVALRQEIADRAKLKLDKAYPNVIPFPQS